MALRCCNSKVVCPGAGNLDFDSPFANLSSETPDIDGFVGLSWSWQGHVPSLGSEWIANSCLGVCVSTVSQEDADLCAFNLSAECEGNDDGTGGGGGGGGGGTVPLIIPRPNPRTLFLNNPETCIAECPDGIGFAYTTPAGRYVARSQIEADRAALSEANRFAANARMCLGDLASSVCLGSDYESTLFLTGGTAPITFTVVSGELPPGLFIELLPEAPRSMVLHGTATTGGAYTFTIRADDANGLFMQKSFTISVAGIDQSSLPQGTVGDPYSETLTVSNMVPQEFWDIISGSLPDGLDLNGTTGAIHGTPTTAGTSTFTVRCTDAAGLACSKQFSIAVVASAGCPTLKTTIILPTHFGLNQYWAQYSATPGDLAHPNKWFNSDFTAVDYHDADTDTFLGTTNLPAGHRIWGYSADTGNSRVYFPGAESAFAYVLPFALDVNTLAFTSGPHYFIGAFTFPAYDSAHTQVAFFAKDGPGATHMIIFDGTTLAQVNDFTILAIGETLWASCYDPTRDLYFTASFSGGGSWIRGFRRTDGAKLFEQSINPQRGFSIRRIASVDKLYIGTWDTVNYRCIVMDPVTGALDAQILLSDSITYGAEDYTAKGFVALTGPNRTFFIRVSDNTIVCDVLGAGNRGAVYGTKFANYSQQVGDLLVYQ